MKTAIAFFFCAILISAEDNPTIAVKRVASFHWDVQTGKLDWIVQTGSEGEKGFVPSSEQHYEISPKDGVMTDGGHERGFTAQEAKGLGDLLHILTGYCVARTVWWLNGDSTSPEESSPTAPPPSKAQEPTTTPEASPIGAVAPQVRTIPITIQPARDGLIR